MLKALGEYEASRNALDRAIEAIAARYAKAVGWLGDRR